MYKCIEANVVKEVLLHCISGRNSKIVVRRLGFLVENGKRQDKVNQTSVMYKYKKDVEPLLNQVLNIRLNCMGKYRASSDG